MPYNNDFNSITKRYNVLKEEESAKNLLFENFEITEEEYQNARLLSTIEEMDAYYAGRSNDKCSTLVEENSNSDVVVLKYLKQGEDIV